MKRILSLIVTLIILMVALYCAPSDDLDNTSTGTETGTNTGTGTGTETGCPDCPECPECPECPDYIQLYDEDSTDSGPHMVSGFIIVRENDGRYTTWYIHNSKIMKGNKSNYNDYERVWTENSPCSDPDGVYYRLDWELYY